MTCITRCPSLALKSYDVSLWDAAICLVSLFSGAPFAFRHLETSNVDLEHFYGHRVLALVEMTPVVGGLFALIEKVIVFVYRTFFYHPHQMWPQRKLTPEEAVEHMVKNSRKALEEARKADPLSRDVLATWEEVNEVNDWIKTIVLERERISFEIGKLTFVKKVYKSEANFILLKVENAQTLYYYLTQNQIVVRDRSKVILCEDCLRITIGTKQENEKLMSILNKFNK